MKILFSKHNTVNVVNSKQTTIVLMDTLRTRYGHVTDTLRTRYGHVTDTLPHSERMVHGW